MLVFLQVVLEVLLSAAAAGRRFHVVVLDSRPELEGRQMLRRLLQVGTGSPCACLSHTCAHNTTHLLLKFCPFFLVGVFLGLGCASPKSAGMCLLELRNCDSS